MNSFLDYLNRRRHEKSAVGDLARDVLFDFGEMCPRHGPRTRLLCDPGFITGPCSLEAPDSIATLIHHLEAHGACEDALAAAARAWYDYEKWCSESPPHTLAEAA